LSPIARQSATGTSYEVIRQIQVTETKDKIMKQKTASANAPFRLAKTNDQGRHSLHLKRELLICLGWLRLLKAIASEEPPAGGRFL